MSAAKILSEYIEKKWHADIQSEIAKNIISGVPYKHTVSELKLKKQLPLEDIVPHYMVVVSSLAEVIALIRQAVKNVDSTDDSLPSIGFPGAKVTGSHAMFLPIKKGDIIYSYRKEIIESSQQLKTATELTDPNKHVNIGRLRYIDKKTGQGLDVGSHWSAEEVKMNGGPLKLDCEDNYSSTPVQPTNHATPATKSDPVPAPKPKPKAE